MVRCKYHGTFHGKYHGTVQTYYGTRQMYHGTFLYYMVHFNVPYYYIYVCMCVCVEYVYVISTFGTYDPNNVRSQGCFCICMKVISRIYYYAKRKFFLPVS